MARVRICKFCGVSSSPDEFFCSSCGASLSGISLSDDTDTIGIKDSMFAESIATAGDRLAGVVSESEIAIAFLKFPWGVLQVRGELCVGRDTAYSAQSEKFSRCMTVSGRHARIFFQDSEWFVRDVGSTNGTYLNSMKIEPNKNTEIRDGDLLHFSRACEAIFRLGVG